MGKVKKANGVFEGGGVKGIGLIGALKVAEERGYRFEHVAGNSAGAIVASLIAAGYNADELKKIMEDFKFSEMLRPTLLSRIPLIGVPLQLRRKLGLYNARYLYDTMEKHLTKKGIKTFRDLRTNGKGPHKYKLQVITSDISRGCMTVLPNDLPKYGLEPDEFPVAKAVRMSMSIPMLFVPVKMKGSVFVDGVLCSNYPVWIFDDADRKIPTFGFKIMSSEQYRPKKIDTPKKLIESSVLTLMEASDQRYIREADFNRTINIDTKKVGIAEFWLKKKDEKYLYDAGLKAATEFFDEYVHDNYMEAYGNQLGKPANG